MFPPTGVLGLHHAQPLPAPGQCRLEADLQGQPGRPFLVSALIRTCPREEEVRRWFYLVVSDVLHWMGSAGGLEDPPPPLSASNFLSAGLSHPWESQKPCTGGIAESPGGEPRFLRVFPACA